MFKILSGALVLLVSASTLHAARPAPREGKVAFALTDSEAKVPPHFQLQPHEFTFTEQPLGEVSQQLSISYITFPSPVETEHPLNNTVHCEYYRPKGDGPYPGVIVLHILGGDFELSRLFCNALAHKGTAALFVKMPFYGERRDPKSRRRMVSHQPEETVAGMTQAILDIRRATAWLAARDEVDDEQLGIMGISLGGITGALAATAEPRLKNVCLLLAGGDLSRVAWEAEELKETRATWEKQGGTRESLVELMKTIDPVTYGENVRGKRILMLNADEDEVIPRVCTEALWKAFGEPEIVWYRAGHYSCARYVLDAMSRVTKFFADRKG